MPEALLIDDEPQSAARARRSWWSARASPRAAAATSRRRARCWRSACRTSSLADLVLPDGSGLDLLERARRTSAGHELVLITGNATVESAVEALRARRAPTTSPSRSTSPRLKTVLANVARTLEYKERDRQRSAASCASSAASARMIGALASDAGGLRPDRQGGAHRRDASWSSGESGTGKELVAQTDPRAEPPPARPVPRRSTAARCRPTSSRASSSATSAAASPAPRNATRTLRARVGRHALPRRDHRDAARAAGEAAARARDRRGAARRRRRAGAGRRPRRRGDQPRSRRRPSPRASCARTSTTA